MRATLQEIQRDHAVFVSKMGWRGSKTPLESVALICEEIGELTHELRMNDVNMANVGDELSDIILRTIDLAYELKINITTALNQKVDKNISNIDALKARGRRL